MQISNESIIYLYIKLKHEVITMDNKKKELEDHLKERKKAFLDQFKDGKLPPGMEVIAKLSKMFTGEEPDAEKLKADSLEQFHTFAAEIRKLYKDEIQFKLDVLKELELPYSVIKDEYPELVKKYTDHLINNQGLNQKYKDKM